VVAAPGVTERPARTLTLFAAGLAIVFGAAYGVGRALPDRAPTHPGDHVTVTTMDMEAHS